MYNRRYLTVPTNVHFRNISITYLLRICLRWLPLSYLFLGFSFSFPISARHAKTKMIMPISVRFRSVFNPNLRGKEFPRTRCESWNFWSSDLCHGWGCWRSKLGWVGVVESRRNQKRSGFRQLSSCFKMQMPSNPWIQRPRSPRSPLIDDG
jgi:hypothetical protein